MYLYKSQVNYTIIIIIIISIIYYGNIFQLPTYQFNFYIRIRHTILLYWKNKFENY